MKTGDIIYIKNGAGKLKVILDKELNSKDVRVGYGDDSFPTLKRPRMEFHKRNGEIKMMTIYDNEQGKATKESPNIIYVTFLHYDEVEVWEANFDSCEKDDGIYETIE